MSEGDRRTRPREEGESFRQGCALCGHRFSSEDARFCPFDGEPLRPVTEVERDPRVGTVFGDRYLVEAVLGEGGMGVVYRIRHRTLGKAFALKLMREGLAADPMVAARFVQEARAMAALEHPNVVTITDFGEADGVPYFVMELLEGESLASLLRREGALPPRRAMHIVRQIASALVAAHAVGIVHRDLKPDNVHVGRGDAVKILDFGIAKILGSSRLTRTGMIFGTPHYLSPEQATGQAVDHRADIYSLGVVLYELLTGRVPFEADTFMGVLTKHLHAEPTPPSQLRPSDPALGELEPVVLRCLQKTKEARFASAADLVAALDRVGDEELPAPRPVRRPAPRFVAIAVGVVALAAAILVLAFARSMPKRPALAESPRSPAPAPTNAPSAAVSPVAFTAPEPAPSASIAEPRPAPSAERPPKRPSPKPGKSMPPEPESLRAREIIDPWAD